MSRYNTETSNNPSLNADGVALERSRPTLARAKRRNRRLESKGATHTKKITTEHDVRADGTLRPLGNCRRRNSRAEHTSKSLSNQWKVAPFASSKACFIWNDTRRKSSRELRTKWTRFWISYTTLMLQLSFGACNSWRCLWSMYYLHSSLKWIIISHNIVILHMYPCAFGRHVAHLYLCAMC